MICFASSSALLPGLSGSSSAVPRSAVEIAATARLSHLFRMVYRERRKHLPAALGGGGGYEGAAHREEGVRPRKAGGGKVGLAESYGRYIRAR